MSTHMFKTDIHNFKMQKSLIPIL